MKRSGLRKLPLHEAIEPFGLGAAGIPSFMLDPLILELGGWDVSVNMTILRLAGTSYEHISIGTAASGSDEERLVRLVLAHILGEHASRAMELQVPLANSRQFLSPRAGAGQDSARMQPGLFPIIPS